MNGCLLLFYAKTTDEIWHIIIASCLSPPALGGEQRTVRLLPTKNPPSFFTCPLRIRAAVPFYVSPWNNSLGPIEAPLGLFIG